MKRPSLAVVMMTKNEEQRLVPCLERVAGWADEIVIIDDMSTDRTVEIARRYTEKVFVMPSEDNHAQQWNRGMDRAASEWILHIDADELVTPQLQAAIDRALAQAGDYSAFELMRKNVFLGRPMRYGGWYHRYVILFRKDRARCVGKGIHATRRIEGRIGRLQAEVQHYPFTSIAQFIDRQNHYTSVEARVALESGASARPRDLYAQAALKPLKFFWKCFVKKQGYRDGWHGFVFACLAAFAHFLLWAKIWEGRQAE